MITIISISVVCIILIFMILIYSQKKACIDNPVFHTVENGRFHVNVFYTSKTGGNYQEFVFERVAGQYKLSRECRDKIIHSVKIISFISLILAVSVGVVLFVQKDVIDNKIFLWIVVVVFLVIMITYLVNEYYHYKLAVEYLKLNV